jgi:hypothetical protein
MERDGRSAHREDSKGMPTRCLMICWLPGCGRERTVEIDKESRRAWEGSRMCRRGWWRGIFDGGKRWQPLFLVSV